MEVIQFKNVDGQVIVAMSCGRPFQSEAERGKNDEAKVVVCARGWATWRG